MASWILKPCNRTPFFMTIQKTYKKAIRYKSHPNYVVTFSRAEDNAVKTELAIKHGINVAAVFNELPDTWRGVEVVDGDKSDLQMLKYNGVILGLKAKGAAAKRYNRLYNFK